MKAVKFEFCNFIFFISESHRPSRRRPSGRDHSAPQPHRGNTIRAQLDEQLSQLDNAFLNQTPNLPQHFQQKQTVADSRPPPQIRPKPRVAPKPRMNPTARVLYDYTAGDNDELTLGVGDIVEVRLKNFNFV